MLPVGKMLEVPSLLNLGESSHGEKNVREKKEAPPGFEPGMVDLQSTALATWPRRHVLVMLDSVMPTDKVD